MIRKINIADPQVAEDVLSVQIPSYETEAKLINSYNIPPLKDTIKNLQQSGETFYGYYIKDILGGVISFKIENNILDIHRLFVYPDHFRKGIANYLLDYVQINEKDFHMITVSTGSENVPAINFYEKSGFIKIKEIVVESGLPITLLEKRV